MKRKISHKNKYLDCIAKMMIACYFFLLLLLYYVWLK